MRAKQHIQPSTDITSQIPPLAHSLYSTFLSSHCSSCFLPLPTTTTTLHHCNTTVCSSLSSSIHHAAAEHNLLTLLTSHPSLYPHFDTSDLRLALRLIPLLPSHPPSLARLLGLITNHHLIIHDPDHSSRVRAGARVIAAARGRVIEFNGDGNMGDDEGVLESRFELEEAVLCLVITNSVEINLNGQRVGIGVYGCGFSWINHSCSPNSCFRFVPWSEVSENVDGGSLMRIFPCGDAQMEEINGCAQLSTGVSNYGPRIIIRSIKEIERGEEVTITYTDLLQPTAWRRSELLLEYKFFCSCKRCIAIPQAYVDHALQEMFCVDLHKGCPKTLDKHNKELAFEKLRDMLDSAIAEYMEEGCPVSCCEKVERLLCEAQLGPHPGQINEASNMQFKLSPLHSLSLNAYTTLISTYKIRAALKLDETHLQTIIQTRISAAYSLLLAGATNHLFLSEPSLIASTATFWIDAGQSLLQFAGSSLWNSSATELRILSALTDINCPNCSLMARFKSVISVNQTQDKSFKEISMEFHRCVSTIIPKIWIFLIQGSKYLENVKSPNDFSWIQAMRTPDNTLSLQDDHILFSETSNGDPGQSANRNEPASVKTDILQLGVHCFLYGSYLSGICYGDSCTTQLIQSVIVHA